MSQHVSEKGYVREDEYTGVSWEMPAAKWERILATVGFPHTYYIWPMGFTMIVTLSEI